MKRILLRTVALTSITLTSCEAIASKTGMSGTDLLLITTDAATRAKAGFDATQAQIKAARARQRTAAKNPVPNVQP
jgi:hypothetical protein